MAMDVTATGAHNARRSKGDAAPPNPANFFEKLSRLPDSRFRTTESGLKVAVVKEGEGKPLSPGMVVTVNYTGWTDAGVQFDTSMEKGQPFTFRLGAGRVIKGWEEGLAGIKPGERRQLIVPAELAYGDRQMGKIPAGSTLIFNVEAVSVEDGHANPNGGMSLMA